MDILSIDFDIIMAPVIEYYNGMVPRRTWNDIQEENPGLITPKADFFHYNILIQLLEKNIKKDSKIYIAFNHKMIIDFLEDDNNLNIVNIDHHHDLGYDEKDDTKEGTLNSPNCGNWAKYLFDSNKMKNYVWIKNVNSVGIVREKINEQMTKYEILEKNFCEFYDKILSLNFDKIFICLSPEWVPPYYHTLFYGLLDWLNFKFNYHLEIHEGS